MRVLLSFLQDNVNTPHPIPAYRFWSYYIKNGVEESGMQWMEIPNVDWAEGLVYAENSPSINAWKAKTWEQTLDYVKKNAGDIDIFLSYLYPKQIDSSAIMEIRRLGIPCVNFYCDSVREFIKVPDEFKIFDLMWVPEYEALYLYKNAGVKYLNMPMPMWINKDQRLSSAKRDNGQITFIGSKDILREKLLSDVSRQGLDVSIYGRGWLEETKIPADFINHSFVEKIRNQLNFIGTKGIKSFFIKQLQSKIKLSVDPINSAYLNGVPEFDDYITLTKSSTITLGINQVPTYKRLNTSPLKYSRLRDIEAPMLGACYLTEYSEGLGILYDLENEIHVYNDPSELKYKANELLKNEAKRKLLRINGQKRALNDHSITATMNKLKKSLLNGQ